jgi:hypothetical protein
VLVNGVRSVKVRRSAALEICKAYSLGDRWSGELTGGQAGSRLGGVVVVPAPGPGASPCAGRGTGPDADGRLGAGPDAGPGPGLALRHDHGAAVFLAEAARVALREAGAGGEGAAARDLLLAVLDGHVTERLKVRKNTVALVVEVSDRWQRLWQQGQDENNALERVLLPRFVPIVPAPTQTLATAIGGARLHGLCCRAYESAPLGFLTMATTPAVYALFLCVLTARDAAVLPVLLWATVSSVALSVLLSLLLLNTEVLLRVIMVRFDTYWSLFNVFSVAATGSRILADRELAAVWVSVQVYMASHFFLDAAPPSPRARRSICFALVCYVLFQGVALFALWQSALESLDKVVSLFGVPLNLRQWCFAAQANVIIISTRFAFRALSKPRSLVFCAGLARVWLPAAEATELRALMLAERRVRKHGRIDVADPATPPPSHRGPREPATDQVGAS